MKSRKKVSRKKAAHKTRTRRSRNRNNRRTKRGGMMRSARAVAGTLLYHDILPLIRARQIINNTGRDPQPQEGSITLEDERFYRTFADIPVDDGIKDSIRNLREELKNPVKNADKMKSIKEKYDAIIAKLEQERKKQIANQERRLMIVGKPSRQPSQYIASVTDVGSDVSSLKTNQPILELFVNQPFSSPNTTRNPDYSTQKGTPSKPPSKSELVPHRPAAFEGNDEPNTPSKILFGTETPVPSPQVQSPPPPPPQPQPEQRKTQENWNPHLQSGPLSPDTTIPKKLNFDQP